MNGEAVLVRALGGYLVMKAGLGCHYLRSKNPPVIVGTPAPVVSGLPWSSMSIDPTGAAALCSAVMARPLHVLEFGSGVSTLLIALAGRVSGNPIQIVSVEQDEMWVDRVRVLASELGFTAEQIHVRFAGLKPFAGRAPFPVNRWYDPLALTGLDGPFDLILVDGPSAFRPEWAYDRWEAIEFIDGRLAPGGQVILDDTHREGEREIARDWATRFAPGGTIQDKGRSTWFSPMVDRSHR